MCLLQKNYYNNYHGNTLEEFSTVLLTLHVCKIYLKGNPSLRVCITDHKNPASYTWQTTVMTHFFASVCVFLHGYYFHTWSLLISLEVNINTFGHFPVQCCSCIQVPLIIFCCSNAVFLTFTALTLFVCLINLVVYCGRRQNNWTHYFNQCLVFQNLLAILTSCCKQALLFCEPVARNLITQIQKKIIIWLHSQPCSQLITLMYFPLLTAIVTPYTPLLLNLSWDDFMHLQCTENDFMHCDFYIALQTDLSTEKKCYRYNLAKLDWWPDD